MAVKLSFGTAGIRAPLGDGDDQLNLRTVRVVAHALAQYVAAVVPDARSRGLCVGFDGRTASDAFAREVCAVALAHGFVVRSFETPIPTPLLAFATARHAAALGIMITASHNPPSDNGIKVYFQGGARILPPHDAEIARHIASEVDASSIPRADLITARQAGQLLALGDADRDAYLSAVLALVPSLPEAPLPPIAYSALCGVGSELTRTLLSRARVQDVREVLGQALPRADFGGLASPNPEHAEALTAVLALAEQSGAGLAFCHDPDADRLAVAARDRAGQLRVLSGDEVGALLGDFMLSLQADPTRNVVVSTLVSAELLREIASASGCRFEQTLTGFKWIAQRARSVEQASGLRYLFGYEEALGYAFGALGDDKDGIAALYVLLELARRLGQGGLTLIDQLESLARAHGLFATRQVTLSAAGEAGKAHVAETVRRLREAPPESWLGSGATREDFLNRAESRAATREPPANLLVFRTPSGARLCVRPSGTEPKLKLYLQVHQRLTEEETFTQAQARAQGALDALEGRLRQLAD